MCYQKELFSYWSFAPVLIVLLFGAVAVSAQTTSFTYQGRLTDGGAPANNNYDLQFTLWDAAIAGNQQPQPAPTTMTKTNVAVTGGVFSVLLDFGVSAFPGADRFLEVGVRPGDSGGVFTMLAPRQQISSTPYALHTLNATAADSLSSACVGCVTDSQINSIAASKLTGTIPASSIPPSTGNYIQNTTAEQTNANFNVSGNGIIGGNAGVGTTTPTSKLDVRGHLTLDAGSSPVLYTGTNNAELNRYLQLINSPAAPSASGLKAGGVLVADTYDYANPGKNNLVVKGNIGIGTSSAVARLDVRGTLALDPGQSPSLFTAATGGEQNRYLQLFNSPSFFSASGLKAGGLLVSDSYAFANPGKNDLIVKGNTGIGIATPRHRLSVAGGPGWTSAVWGGAVELTNGSAIGWQTNAAGSRFGIGHTNGGLFFFRTAADPGSITGAPDYDMLIADSGNVGIGSIAPESKLHLSGRASLLSPFRGMTIDQNLGAAGADFSGYSFQVRSTLNNVTTTDFIINSLGNVGIGTAAPTTAKLVVSDTSIGTGVAGFSSAGSGVFGESASARGWGVYGRNNAGGYAVYADGNAGQGLDKGGFVKAMALVKDDGKVVLCYNSQATGTDINTPPCKIKVTFQPEGYYLVDFGFDVFNRFISLTPRTLTDNQRAPIDVTATLSGPQSNHNQVRAFFRSSDGARTGFYIFLY